MSDDEFEWEAAQWSEPERAGYLTKRGHVVKNWKVRWFVLQQSKLWYFSKRGASLPLDCIPLEGATIEQTLDTGTPHTLVVRPAHKKKKWYVRATDGDELRAWLEAIQRSDRSTKLALPESFSPSALKEQRIADKTASARSLAPLATAAGDAAAAGNVFTASVWQAAAPNHLAVAVFLRKAGIDDAADLAAYAAIVQRWKVTRAKITNISEELLLEEGVPNALDRAAIAELARFEAAKLARNTTTTTTTTTS